MENIHMPVNFWASMIRLYTFGKHFENPISSVRDTNLPEDRRTWTCTSKGYQINM